MPPELEVPLDLHDVLVGRTVLLHHLQDLDLQLELLVELVAHLQDLQRVVPAVLVVQHLQHLPERPRTQDLDDLEAVGDVVADQRLVVILLIAEAVLVLRRLGAYLAKVRLVADVVDILVFFDFDPLEIGQVLVVEVVLDGRVVAVSHIHAAQLTLHHPKSYPD